MYLCIFYILQMVFKPSYCLGESLLLCELVLFHTKVRTDCKTMFNSTKEVDLIWLANLFENLFRLMTKGGGEYFVRFFAEKSSVTCDKEILKMEARQDLPAAAIERGPLIASSSSVATKEGCAVYPALMLLSSFRKRTMY